MSASYEAVIIGGGPGGYVAAIRLAQLGKKVALIEESELGGTCLNKGCIPTKAMLKSSEMIKSTKKASEFGVDVTLNSVSLGKIIERSKGIVNTLNQGVAGLLSKNKVEVINGRASLKNRNNVLVGDNEISASNIIIATGAKPRLIPGLESLIEKGLVWTSKEALNPAYLPKKLLVVGSGAIGVEFASFYREMGADVTIVEIQDTILIQEDREISAAATKVFQKKGIKIKTSCKTENYREVGGKVAVDLTSKSGDRTTEEYDTCILAIGVVPNTNGLGLEQIGVQKNPNGTIVVDEFNQTSVPNIYAIGDIVDVPWLAHKASREGIIVAEKISGNVKTKKSAVPACTYSDPQIASIGLNEEKAKAQFKNLKIGKSYFRGNGKALTSGESDGFIKVIFDGDTGELLGAHMIGHEVTELIPVFSLAIASELTEEDFMNAVFPHPTISEVIQEAVLGAFGRAIHG